MKISPLRVWVLIQKETRQLLRDPQTKRLMFAAPIIQLLLFGYAVNTDVRNVATVVVDDQVLRPERCDAAYRGSFLSDGQMHGPVHLAAYVQILGLLLKVPDLAHLLQHPGQLLMR